MTDRSRASRVRRSSRMLRAFVVTAATVALVLTACTGDDAPSADGAAPSLDPASLVAQVASSDHHAGAPQRLAVGVFAGSPEGGPRLVTAGSVDVTVAPFGDGAGTPVEGAARFVPAPGTTVPADGPTLRTPDVARGVYELADVTFDEAGVWQATVRFTVDGTGPFEIAATPFEVLDRPAYPAPGDEALRTENLTIRSDAPAEAIDSAAIATGEVPDPELHRWTIADALEEGRPIVALFATPRFCESLLCGPVTDALRDLARTYDDKAVFVHVEIWRKHPSTLNEAAADWLFRDGNLTEPWLFVIDDRGTILDRWSPLFDPDEVGELLAAMPDMPR